MGFFRNLLRTAAPIVGGIFGGPVGAAIGGGVAGLLGGEEQADQQQAAGAVAQPYVQQGTAAVNQQSALLGLGGDTQGAKVAYNNYLNSVGYQGQLKAGQQAITTSAAARGLLGSGSTAKSLVRYGDQLGRENFNNYLGQLGGVASMGLSAAPTVANANMTAANTRASGWDQLIGGLGGAYDAWQAGRANRPVNALPTQAPGPVQTTIQPYTPPIRTTRRETLFR
jgi:hypothetical protein